LEKQREVTEGFLHQLGGKKVEKCTTNWFRILLQHTVYPDLIKFFS